MNANDQLSQGFRGRAEYFLSRGRAGRCPHCIIAARLSDFLPYVQEPDPAPEPEHGHEHEQDALVQEEPQPEPELANEEPDPVVDTTETAETAETVETIETTEEVKARFPAFHIPIS